MLFAAADYNVMLFDISDDQISGALEDIQKQLGDLEATGLLRGVLTAKQQFNNISTTSVLRDCVKEAIYIQVNISLIRKKQDIN